MIKYEIRTDSFEFRQKRGDAWTEDEIVREYLSHDTDDRLVDSFDTLEEAEKAFSEFEAYTYEEKVWVGQVLTGKLYILVKAEYDGEDLVQADYIYIKAEPFGIVTLNGYEVRYNECEQLMDDEIREDLHIEMSPCTKQEFIDEYCKRHKEKYGIDFIV